MARRSPLHDAAALGQGEKVAALLADGARASAMNEFRKLPEDVCTNSEVRAVLVTARSSETRAEAVELKRLAERVAELELALAATQAQNAELDASKSALEYRTKFLLRALNYDTGLVPAKQASAAASIATEARVVTAEATWWATVQSQSALSSSGGKVSSAGGAQSVEVLLAASVAAGQAVAALKKAGTKSGPQFDAALKALLAAKAAYAKAAPEAAKKAGGGSNSSSKKKKKKKGGGGGGESKKGGAKPMPQSKDGPVIARLQLVVGKIVEITAHPDADSLYIEKIDIGEAEPRQIISGLRKFYTEEQMLGRLLVVVANLKPSKLKGTKSAGMVLCAASDDHSQVELVDPPAGSVAGDVIHAEGIPATPDAKVDAKKKNHAWRKSIPLLRTNGERVAVFEGIPLVVDGKGQCTVSSLGDMALG